MKTIKNQIVTKYGTFRKFAENLGISEQALHNKLRTPSKKFLLELKSHGIGENINNEGGNEYTLKPYYNYFPLLTTVYAGDSHMLLESTNIREYIPLVYPKSDRCFFVEVEGDSMFNDKNNRSTKEGDKLFVRMDDSASPGDIVIVRTKQGRQYIKQLQQKNGEYLLHSFNSQYPDLLIHEEEIECIYKVHEIFPKSVKV